MLYGVKMVEFLGSEKRYAQIMGAHLNHEPELEIFDLIVLSCMIPHHLKWIVS